MAGERNFRALRSSEVSQNETEHAESTAGQWMLGGLALYGAARYLPRLAAQNPALRSFMTEQLTALATKVPLEEAAVFFDGLRHYANRGSWFSDKALTNQGIRRLRSPMGEWNALQESFKRVRTDRAAQNALGADNPDRARYFMEEAIGNYHNAAEAVNRVHRSGNIQDRLFDEWHQAIVKESNRRAQYSRLSNMVDMEHLSVGEGMRRNLLNDRTRSQFDAYANMVRTRLGQRAEENFLNLPLDHRMFVNQQGAQVDFRGLMKTYRQGTNVLATDWHVPFVKINPFTILGFNQARTLQDESFSRIFPLFSRGPSLYHKARGMPEAGNGTSALMFVGNKMLEVTQKGQFNVSEGWHLTTPGSMFGQHIRRMTGMKVQDYTNKVGANQKWLNIVNKFDLFQQEMEPEGFSWLNVDSWHSTALNKFFGKVSPKVPGKEWDQVHDLMPQVFDPLAGPDVHMREYRVAFQQSKFNLSKMNLGDLWTELKAGRHEPGNVTTATLMGYTTAYKVNVALNQVGLGLSVDSMGSTVDFFKNLVTKRVLPAMGLFYAWRGANELLGPASPASLASYALQGWQSAVSGVSSVLGMPDRLSRLGELMPGFDQIGDFPLLPLPNNRGEISVLTVKDLMPIASTSDDLEEERKYGVTPIRRGRYWSVGNTPYTGSDVIGYAPHWSRMVEGSGDMAYGPAAQRGMEPQATGGGNSSYYVQAGPMGSVGLYSGPAGSGIGAGGGYDDGTGDGMAGVPLGSGKIRNTIRVNRGPGEEDGPVTGAISAAMNRTSDLMGFTGFAFRTAFGIDRTKGASWFGIGGIGNTLWHSQVGGFGGTISEVLRRFFPPDGVDDSGDTTASGLPSWTPGPSAFKDFQHGFAYEKVPMGRYTLPGPIFAKMWHMPDPDFSLEAGLMGEDHQAVNAWWNYSDPHRLGIGGNKDGMEEQLTQAGYQVSKGGRVVNEQAQIFTDVPFFIQNGKQSVPVFVAEDGEERGGATDRRAAFAAAQLGVAQSLVFYREGDAGLTAMPIHPDMGALSEEMQRVAAQRNHLREAIKEGRANGMEYYHPAYRMLSLAMTTPTSDEYQEASKLVSSLKLTPELERVVKQARQIAKGNKKKMRVYPYQFAEQEMTTIEGEVEAVLDHSRIRVAGYAAPIRLAGVHVLPGEQSQKATEYVDQTLKLGTKVRVTIGANEAWKLKRDTAAIRGIVEVGGTNVGEELAKMGLAEEDEDDDSVAGYRQRFSPAQRAFGTAWEKFAHLPLLSHTKFLQVKSPVEAYMDREIFGKSFQSWDSPLKDFLIPTLQSFAHHGTVPAILGGAAIGYKFGNTSVGRMVFTLAGAAAGGITAAAIAGKSALSGKSWTPQRRKEQWELETYMDALKYVKALRNFHTYADMAKSKEDFDVTKYLQQQESRKRENSYRKDLLAAKKHAVQKVSNSADFSALAAKLHLTGEYASKKELLAAINKLTSQHITENRDVQPVGPMAAQALSWYKEAKQTMQGWQPGDSIADLIAALPAIDRKYFPMLIDSSPRELKKLEKVAPAYLTRAIHLAHGEQAEDTPSLDEIFAEHGLPGPNWEGWRADVSLGDVRIKIVRREGMDMHGMGIYPQEVETARRSGIKNVPKFGDYADHKSPREIEAKLRSILGSGAIDHDIDIVHGGNGVRVELNHEQDRRDEVRSLLRTLPSLF